MNLIKTNKQIQKEDCASKLTILFSGNNSYFSFVFFWFRPKDYSIMLPYHFKNLKESVISLSSLSINFLALKILSDNKIFWIDWS